MGEEAREGFLKEVTLYMALEDQLSLEVRRDMLEQKPCSGIKVETAAMAGGGGPGTSPSQCPDEDHLLLAHPTHRAHSSSWVRLAIKERPR